MNNTRLLFCDEQIQLLAKKQLWTVINNLTQYPKDTEEDRFAEKTVSSVKEILDPLSSFLLKGAKDPERDKILSQLSQQLAKAIDETKYKILSSAGTDHPMQVAYKDTPPQLRGNNEEALAKLFSPNATRDQQALFEQRKMIFNYLYGCRDAGHLTEYLLPWIEANQASNEALVSMGTMVSALCLSLVEVFNASKLKLLYRFTQHRNEKLSGWALAAYMLVIAQQSTRISILEDKQKELVPSPFPEEDNGKLMSLFLKWYFGTFNTLRRDAYYQKHVLPKLKGFAGKLMDQMQGNNVSIDEMMHMQQDDEMKAILSDMEEQRVEIGDDFYSSTIPFREKNDMFLYPVNWLMPFDIDHYLISEQKRKLFSLLYPHISGDKSLCSNDMYCYTSALKLDGPMEALGAGAMLEELMQQAENEPPVWSEGDKEEGIKDFLFTAFRFFYLYPQRSLLINPFEKHTIFVDQYPCQTVPMNDSDAKVLSGLLIRSEEHLGAYKLLKPVARTAKTYRLMALLAEKTNTDSLKNDILELLEKAHQLEPKHPGTLLKLADIAVEDEDFNRAKELMSQIQAKDQEQLAVITRLAQLYFQMNELDKSLELYFKGVYLSEGKDAKLTRGLARVLFHLKRYDEAAHHWAEMSRNALLAPDLMAYGNILLQKGETNTAMDLYKQWLSLTQASLSKWENEYSAFAKERYTFSEWRMIYDIIKNEDFAKQ